MRWVTWVVAAVLLIWSMLQRALGRFTKMVRRLYGDSQTRLFGRLALLCFVWGLQLLRPDVNTFASNPSAFSGLAAFASEDVWGTIIFLVGIAAFPAMYFRRPYLALLLSVFSCLFWAVVAAGFFTNNPLGTGWLVYAWVAFQCGEAVVMFMGRLPERTPPEAEVPHE